MRANFSVGGDVAFKRCLFIALSTLALAVAAELGTAPETRTPASATPVASWTLRKLAPDMLTWVRARAHKTDSCPKAPEARRCG